MNASKEGHVNVVDQLLQYGAPLDVKNNVGDRCTDYLCSLSFLMILYSTLFQDGMTAMMLAAKGGYSGVVNLLLEHGAEVDLRHKVRFFNLAHTNIDTSPSSYFPVAHRLSSEGFHCFDVCRREWQCHRREPAAKALCTNRSAKRG